MISGQQGFAFNLKMKQLALVPLFAAVFLAGSKSSAQFQAGHSYRIITTCGNGMKVMDVSDGSTNNYASVILATRDNARQSQIFKIEKYGTAYKFTAQHSGKVLDVLGKSTQQGGKIDQYVFEGTTNQLFRIRNPSSGIYEFQNMNSGLYIDLAGANTTDGNTFIQYGRNGTCAQRFKLEEAIAVNPTPTPSPAPSSSPAPAPAPVTTGLSSQQLVSDMSSPHESAIHGINTAWDWGLKPRIGVGVNIPSSFDDPQFVPWGIIGSAASGSSARNTRVQIRKLIVDVKRNGVWSRMIFNTSDREIMGALYTDYETNANIPANLKYHGADGISVKIPDAGGSFHFMSTNRFPFARGAQEIVARLEARLIVDDSSQPDDRASARLLAGSGGDLWKNATQGWDPNVLSNVDFAIGRFRFVTKDWQIFTSHTLQSDSEVSDYLAAEPGLSPR